MKTFEKFTSIVNELRLANKNLARELDRQFHHKTSSRKAEETCWYKQDQAENVVQEFMKSHFNLDKLLMSDFYSVDITKPFDGKFQFFCNLVFDLAKAEKEYLKALEHDDLTHCQKVNKKMVKYISATKIVEDFIKTRLNNENLNIELLKE